jgi:hypothetical protein
MPRVQIPLLVLDQDPSDSRRTKLFNKLPLFIPPILGLHMSAQERGAGEDPFDCSI